MFTTHTGRRYRLPTRAQVRRYEARRALRKVLEAVVIACLLVSPLLADAFLR
jgi:hypothetical protein